MLCSSFLVAAEKVVIVVCADCHFSQENEVQLFIEGLVDKRGKGFIVWLKGGALSVDPDTLAHILIPGQIPTRVPPICAKMRNVSAVAASASATSTRPVNVHERQGCPPFFAVADLVGSRVGRDVSLHDILVHQEKHPTSNSTSTDSYELLDDAINPSVQVILAAQEPVSTPSFKTTRHACSVEKTKTILDWKKLQPYWIRHTDEANEILNMKQRSFLPGQFRRSEPRIPDEVKQDLLKRFGMTSEVEVKIVSNPSGLQWFVKENSREAKETAETESLMLKTRVRHGQVSMEEGDLLFKYPNWIVPECILQKIERDHRNTPNGELNVISDEKGNLRFHVSYSHGQDRLVLRSALSASTILSPSMNVEEMTGYPMISPLESRPSYFPVTNLRPPQGVPTHQRAHSTSNSTSTEYFEFVEDALTPAEQGIVAVQEPASSPALQSYTRHARSIERSNTILDWRKLQHGRISVNKCKLEQPMPFFMPGFVCARKERTERQIPDEIEQDLLRQFCAAPEVEVKIVSNQGVLKWFVEENSREAKETAETESLMLKTRVRHGQVSMEEGDLLFKYPNWIVPECILQKIERDHRNTPNGELNVISDEKGNLRFHVSYSHEQEALDRLFSIFDRPYSGLRFQGFP